jgi:hypothetical protein
LCGSFCASCVLRNPKSEARNPRGKTPNPKLEIRNKSKIQDKNVQNEEALSCEWCSHCPVNAFLGVVSDDACPPGRSWRLGDVVLVIWIFVFEFVSYFVLRISNLEPTAFGEWLLFDVTGVK